MSHMTPLLHQTIIASVFVELSHCIPTLFFLLFPFLILIAAYPATHNNNNKGLSQGIPLCVPQDHWHTFPSVCMKTMTAAVKQGRRGPDNMSSEATVPRQREMMTFFHNETEAEKLSHLDLGLFGFVCFFLFNSLYCF